MSRRSVFEEVNSPPSTANRGLWLDSFLAQIGGDADEGGSAKTRHLDASLKIKIPDGYAEFESAREHALRQLAHTWIFELETKQRTIVGIGAATPWENSITLQRPWGVPIVPGTALKGVAAAYAHKRLEDEKWRRRPEKKQEGGGDWHNLLFGTTEERGLICFHDALWMHDKGAITCGLHLDTITVHHPTYYQKGSEPPADWDTPTPIPFLSFGGKLVSAITWCGGLADEETITRWLEIAYEFLEKALTEEGVGAKTSSGYGRMSIKRKLSPSEERRQDREARMASFVFPKTPGELSQLDQLVTELAADEEFKAPLFQKLVGRVVTLEAEQKRLCRKRLIHLATTCPFLDAAVPEDWKQKTAASSPSKRVAEFEKKLEELKARKPNKKERKKIKKWRNEYERCEKRLQDARKAAKAQSD